MEDTDLSLAQGGKWADVLDGSKETYAETAQAQRAGNYIIFDLGLTRELHDITISTADGAQRIYQADLSVSEDNIDYTKIESFGDEGVVEPPVRNYTADGQGVQARYIKLEITADADAPLRLYEITLTQDDGTSDRVNPDAVITNTSGNTASVNDRDLSTVFLTGETEEGDYPRVSNYRKHKCTKVPHSAERFLQRRCAGGKTRRNDRKRGVLTDTDQTFDAPEGGIYSIRLEFKAGMPAEISEIIVTYGEDASGDVGQATDNIYLDTASRILPKQ